MDNQKMNVFTKTERKSIIFIFLVLFFVTGFNMSISLRRGRDSIRKNDIYAAEGELDTYYQKYRIYPLSNSEGQIIGCFNEDVVYDQLTGYPLNAIPCLIFKDPLYKKGVSYRYESDGYKFKFYISLEGHDEAEYTPAIASKNLQCGTKICNYGRGN